LTGLAIQWGAVGDAGIVINLYGNTDVSIGGTRSQPMSSCLTTLDQFLSLPYAVLTSFVRAESTPVKSVTSSPSLRQAVAKVFGDSANLYFMNTLIISAK